MRWFSLQARKNREIAQLQRKIDEVPSRTELAQYQRRFIELYNQGQEHSTLHELAMFTASLSPLSPPPLSHCCWFVCAVAATLTETKQFYTLYNTLEDQKEFMEKEVRLAGKSSVHLMHLLAA